jgi:hypothetical protein
MPGISARRLVKMAPVAVALLVALFAPAVAFAGETATAGQHHVSYTMRLNPAAPAVHAGETTTIAISFRASHYLHGAPVEMSVSGLPSGVTAVFAPQAPRIGDRITLSLITSVGTPKLAYALTVGAIVHLDSSDPIGTTAPLNLTVT